MKQQYVTFFTAFLSIFRIAKFTINKIYTEIDSALITRVSYEGICSNQEEERQNSFYFNEYP